jgi:hypothetical protein
VRETILLIHGTFAKQDLSKRPQWYEPGSEFISKLDAALERTGSSAK